MWVNAKLVWANIFALCSNALFLILAIAKVVPVIVPIFAFAFLLAFFVWLSHEIQVEAKRRR